MNLPQGKRGQWLAVGILLILLLIAHQHLIAPRVSDYLELQDDLDSGYFQLARYQRIAQSLPELEKYYKEASERQPLTPYLLRGQNRSLAAANLQGRLQNLTNQQNGRIMSTRVLRHAEDGALERVALNARLQISIKGLQQILYQLETEKPYIFIDQITISTEQRRRRGNANTDLDVRLTLYSLRHPDQEEASG